MEIQPDTSIYTDLPNKLRAFALFAESNDPADYRTESGKWRTYDRPGMLVQSVLYCANGTHEYRIKPKPRELWAIQRSDGSYWPDPFCQSKPMIYMEKPDCAPGNTPVRFVEQPE